MTTDHDRIESLVTRCYAAANSKDINGVMACYAVRDPSLLIYDVIPPNSLQGRGCSAARLDGFLLGDARDSPETK